MELLVSLRKLLKNDASWLRIVEVDVFTFNLTFIYPRIWLFIDKYVDNSRIVVRYFGFYSYFIYGFNHSLNFELALEFGLHLVESFSVDNQNRWKLIFIFQEPVLEPLNE